MGDKEGGQGGCFGWGCMGDDAKGGGGLGGGVTAVLLGGRNGWVGNGAGPLQRSACGHGSSGSLSDLRTHIHAHKRRTHADSTTANTHTSHITHTQAIADARSRPCPMPPGRMLMGYIPEHFLHSLGTPRPIFLAGVAAAMVSGCSPMWHVALFISMHTGPFIVFFKVQFAGAPWEPRGPPSWRGSLQP